VPRDGRGVAGHFTMGSPAGDEARYDDEGPQHMVTIAKPFAVGRFAVRRGAFAIFVEETKHKLNGGCYTWTGSEWKLQSDKSRRSPG